MSELHRDLGKLTEGMEWVKSQLVELRSDVRGLNHFKWKVAGGAAAVSIMIGVLMRLVLK
jgi:hypothetical protein